MAHSSQGRAVLAAACALGLGGPARAQDGGVDSEAEADICGPVEKQAHPDPVALVREFVRRDGKGQFLKTSWRPSVAGAPSSLPRTPMRGRRPHPVRSASFPR